MSNHYQCINPKRGRERLARFVSGQMNADEMREFILHVAGCHACEEELALTRQFFEHLKRRRSDG